ncbi:MAG TPA: OmpA family protein [Acidobacteriota bacterium]|nr:OmpA family protein [Acidobacteriota bacterium]
MTLLKQAVRSGLLSILLVLFLAAPAWAQDPSVQPERNEDSSTVQQDPDRQQDDRTNESNQNGQQGAQTPATSAMTFTPGEDYKVKGNVIARDADTVTILTRDNQTLVVGLNDLTEVKERKRNPFRSARKYAITNLLPGLEVEIEGRGDGSGRLLAEAIRFTQDDYRTAVAIETRLNPVERGLSETNQNAERLAGQVSELSAVSNAARGGAVAAQETADQAVQAASRAQRTAEEAHEGIRATNERIVSLDNFDVKHSAVVNFKVNSAQLSPEAKAELDQIARQVANERGYMIEVVGFASADGSAAYNRQLSQRRADSVVRYLAEEHNVPLRRMITPFGFGELQPIADNSTREGRQQNRRVEVKVLVNRGLQAISAGLSQSPSSQQPGDQGRARQNNLQNNQIRGEFGESGTGNTSGTTTGNQTEGE